MAGNPFRALGLDADPGLSDDDVRAAWHRVAAATHPDRADGGDPAAFSAAAAAYSDLRTPFGRGEALADLAGRPARRPPGRLRLLFPPAGRAGRPAGDREPRAAGPGWPARPAHSAAAIAAGRWAARARSGRPARLALLVLSAAAVSVLSVLIDGWQPASIAIIAGAAIWTLRAGRRHLGARPEAGAPGMAARLAGKIRWWLRTQ
jgi:hypothetical protein